LRGQPFRHPDSTGADRVHKLIAMALDRKTGALLWQRVAFEGTVYDEHHKKGTHASPTAVTDGKLVYFYFGAGGLFAYDFDGKQVWTMNPGKLGTIGMGPGTSPVVDDQRVYLQCDMEEGTGSYITALDKKTGKEIWRKDRTAPISWATPVLWKSDGGKTELLTSGLDAVVAYEPATGKELWRSGGVGGNAVPSMVYTQGIAFFTAGYPDKHTIALRPGGSGDVKPLWEYNKGSGYVPSPIAYGEYVYLITDKGILTCLDAKTGEVKYANGRVPVPATFSASPIAFDGKLLLTSEDGETFVIKAGPVHEVLGKNSVGEAVYASPAVAQGTIFIRGAKHLFAIR
jgi:outer membrane protein assembly factor BamB